MKALKRKARGGENRLIALYLKVPFDEKDEAKFLGARWDAAKKKWYINLKKDYYKFNKWLYNADTEYIIYEHIYIAVGHQRCFKCGKDTNAISFAADDYVSIDNESSELYLGEVNFFEAPVTVPELLQHFLKEQYLYYKSFSKTTQISYFTNHCNHCGVIQGNFYLHSEPDSPFFITSEEDAKALTLYKIKLKEDMEFDSIPSWGSGDYLVKRFSVFSEADINTLKGND